MRSRGAADLWALRTHLTVSQGQARLLEYSPLPRIPAALPVQGATIPENPPELQGRTGAGGRSRGRKNRPPKDDQPSGLKIRGSNEHCCSVNTINTIT